MEYGWPMRWLFELVAFGSTSFVANQNRKYINVWWNLKSSWDFWEMDSWILGGITCSSQGVNSGLNRHASLILAESSVPALREFSLSYTSLNYTSEQVCSRPSKSKELQLPSIIFRRAETRVTKYCSVKSFSARTLVTSRSQNEWSNTIEQHFYITMWLISGV